jgi:hypothetical protein
VDIREWQAAEGGRLVKYNIGREDGQTGRQADRQTGRQADRQIRFIPSAARDLGREWLERSKQDPSLRSG